MTQSAGTAPGVAFPGDTAFADATRVFNLTAPVHPAAAATVRTLDEVRAALGRARAEGLAVRVHTTGHGAASAHPMDSALLIRTRMRGRVEIDAPRRIARVPAGATWGDVVASAAPHGLAAAHGSSPLVGVVGYLLRGGVSFYGRRVGLAANAVRAVDLVAADGTVHRATADAEPELLWALRGGGGGFGVVTAVEIELFPAARVVTGAAYWPAAHADRLLARWRRWTLDAPWDVGTSFRVMNLPDLPEIPPPLRGRTVVCVDGAVRCPAEDALPAARGHVGDLFTPLREMGPPLLDTWATADPPAVLEAHMDPREPFPIHGDHLLLGELGDDGAAAFLRMVGEGSGSPLTNAELRQLGGALSRPDPAGGVLDHLDARYAYLGAGVPFGPVTPEMILDHLAAVRGALRPWDTGRTAPSFVERLGQPQRHLDPDQVLALDTVRARIDPEGMFRGDIAPGASRSPDR